MPDLTPQETVRFSLACLRCSAPRMSMWGRARWRAAAASAFHQAGVERHRRLFLAEIMSDFDAAGSARDPVNAAHEKGLLEAVDDRARARVAWYYQTAVAYAPSFAEPLYNLAALQRNAGRLDDAFSLFVRAAGARPHPQARPHAYLRANAFWEAASIALVRDRLAEAETLFRRALGLLDNFGPEHVRFPRLLQRLGKNLEALDHFERITPYAHRYAPEFIEPDYRPDELLPRQSDGTPFDPGTPLRIDGDAANIIYWAHLYFELPRTAPAVDIVRLAKALPGRSFFARGGDRRIHCSPSRDAFAATVSLER